MDTRDIAIVIIDISGYTRFIRSNRSSMVHAEEIIFQLLDTIVEGSTHPLQLNKFEGDAVLMYAETGDVASEVAQSVLDQVTNAFPVFQAKARQLESDRAACPCDACRNIRDLRLKVILHYGKTVFRTIRQFTEIAGEDVIIAHRLLKNTIPLHEYILMTDAFYGLIVPGSVGPGKEHVEPVADVGPVHMRYFAAATPAQ